MGVIAVLKKGFAVTSRSFALVGFLFAVSLVINLANLPFQKPPALMTQREFGILLLLSAVFIVIGIYLQGGVLGYVRRALKVGKTEFSGFWVDCNVFFLRLLGLAFLISVFMLIVSIVALIPMALFITGTLIGPAAWILLLIGFVILGVAVCADVMILFAPYAIVVDNSRIFAALKMSISFVRRNIRKVLGLILLVAALIVGLIVFAWAMFATLFFLLKQPFIVSIIMVIFASAISAYLNVVLTCAFTAQYIGLSRTETTG